MAKVIILLGIILMIAAMWAQWLDELKERQERVRTCQTFYVPQKVRVNCP